MLLKDFLFMCDCFRDDQEFLIFDSVENLNCMYRHIKSCVNFEDCLRLYGDCRLIRFSIGIERFLLLLDLTDSK